MSIGHCRMPSLPLYIFFERSFHEQNKSNDNKTESIMQIILNNFHLKRVVIISTVNFKLIINA